MTAGESAQLTGTTAVETADRQAMSRQSGHRPMAFQLEAMILLVFLTLCLAILSTVFGHSWSLGIEADELSHAICLASSDAENSAEAFAADPTDEASTCYYVVQDGTTVACEANTEDAYTVTRAVESEETEGGTLLHATITVSHADRDVYSLNTARYVSEGRG